MEESLSIYGQMQFVGFNHLRISKLFSKLNHVDWQLVTLQRSILALSSGSSSMHEVVIRLHSVLLLNNTTV